jgi:hypothetical protein
MTGKPQLYFKAEPANFDFAGAGEPIHIWGRKTPTPNSKSALICDTYPISVWCRHSFTGVCNHRLKAQISCRAKAVIESVSRTELFFYLFRSTGEVPP